MVRSDYGLFFLLPAALAIASGRAHALWDDRLEPYASHAAYRDDNVLRRPPELEASTDTYRVSALGLQLDAPLGRQRVRGALSVNSVGYRPHPRITLSLGLRRETRSTSLAFGAYAINVASLGARIGF